MKPVPLFLPRGDSSPMRVVPSRERLRRSSSPTEPGLFRADDPREPLFRLAQQAQRLEAGRIANELSACAAAVGYARAGQPAPLDRARARIEARILERPMDAPEEQLVALLYEAHAIVSAVQHEREAPPSSPR